MNGMQTVTREADATANAASAVDSNGHLNEARGSATIVIIKPEEVEAGTAKSILTFISNYCSENGLACGAVKMRFTEQMLERHFLRRGTEYEKNVGAKVLKALNGIDSPKRYNSEIEAAEDVLGIHKEAYIGREFILVTVTGPDAVEKMGRIKGSTDPTRASPDTIRGRFNTGMTFYDAIARRAPLRNIVHVPENLEELDYDVKTFGVDLKIPARSESV